MHLFITRRWSFFLLLLCCECYMQIFSQVDVDYNTVDYSAAADPVDLSDGDTAADDQEPLEDTDNYEEATVDRAEYDTAKSSTNQRRVSNRYDSNSGTPVTKKVKKVLVPVFVPEAKKKKMKIIAVDKGFYIPGGTQLSGKFQSLKNCMKACALTPTCFSADYNPWLKKCYTHSNFTACNSQSSHPQFTHFSKVPCSVTDAPTGSVALGVSVQNGIEQKGIDSLQQCMKKCAGAGGGVQRQVVGNTGTALLAAFGSQACFAIDYDFATHKCFFFGSNIIAVANDAFTSVSFAFQHCIGGAAVGAPVPPQTPTSLNAIPNPTVVHITFCPKPVAFPAAAAGGG